MLAKLIETLSGKDDLERVAAKGDMSALNAYLKTRRLLIPRRPKQFLDAANFTQDELLKVIEREMRDLADAPFEPWVLIVDGKMRLPAFSSQKKFDTFSRKIAQQLNRVFGVGGAEFLVEDVTRGSDIDFIDLNLFSEKCWEIEVRKG